MSSANIDKMKETIKDLQEGVYLTEIFKGKKIPLINM